MKFKTNGIGIISAVLTTKIGERTIRLNTKSRAEAEAIAKELNLDVIERAGKTVDLSRELIRKLTQNGKKKVIEAISEWEKWLASTSESVNTAHNMASYGYAWATQTKLNAKGVDELTEASVDDWVNDSSDVKLNTRKFRLSVARSILKFCVIKRYIDVNVADLVKVKHKPLTLEQKTNRSKRVFTDEEYSLIKTVLLREIEQARAMNLPKADEDWLRFWYCAVVLGRRTALRLADISNLERECLNDGELSVCTDKKNTWVKCKVDDEILMALSIGTTWSGKSKLFFPKQSAIASDPKRRCQLSNRFRAIMKMCGINDHFFHELRSSRASEIVAQGGEMKDVAKALGHGDEKSSEVYVIGTLR